MSSTEKKFAHVSRREDQKGKVSQIIKKIVKNNQGMRNDCGVMAANDVIKKIVSKSYHEKLLNRVCMH